MPRRNCRRKPICSISSRQGADLVAFSGGKAINGPQATGILCGRRDLVMAAALQHLDFDILWEQWSPPPALIDKGRLKGVPQHGIGRTCKVGKEQIIGLLTALELFVGRGRCRPPSPLDGIGRTPGRRSRGAAGLHRPARGRGAWRGGSDRHAGPGARRGSVGALELVTALQNGTPAIAADPTRWDHGIVIFNPTCLQPGEPEQIAAAIRRLLANS